VTVYMPTNETRCIAIVCRNAKQCARHNCAPGQGHPAGDLSIWAVHGSCGYFEPLNRWPPPQKPAFKPATVHDFKKGLL